MKTTATKQELSNATLEALTIEQKKAIALKEFNNEDYFILEGIEPRIFEGTEQEAREDYESKHTEAKNDDDISFYEYVCSNLTEIEPIEEDEERDNYIVLTDKEADEKAKEYILDSLWAFNPSFLAGENDLDEEVFKAIQDNGKCEGNNEVIRRLIQDEDSFVSSAISADGRGHFMSSYDGHEHEQRSFDEIFYIYRIN